MPTAAAVLNSTKAERDISGGWASAGSERHTRVAKHCIAVMQRAVPDALQKTEDPDPLAESDAVEAMDDFLRSQGVQDQERTRLKKTALQSYLRWRSSRSGMSIAQTR